jgi:hypothetical protein
MPRIYWIDFGSGSLLHPRALTGPKTVADDTDLPNLAVLTDVEILDLDGAHITDAGMEHLGVLTQLEDLSLAGTQITDAGLGCLRHMSKLKWLNLMDTHVSDRGLMALQDLNALQEVNVFNTGVSTRGADEFRGRRPEVKVLMLTRPGALQKERKAQ